MPRISIIAAIFLFPVMLLTMSTIWVKDSTQNPQYCAACHGEYYNSWSQPESNSLAEKHAKRGISCQTCHDRTLGESMGEMVTFVKGYEVPLKEREMPMEKCLACHESYEKIIPLTDPEVTGRERNPHDSPWGRYECNVCHNMHRDSLDYCGGCHLSSTDAPGWVFPGPDAVPSVEDFPTTGIK